MPSRSGFGRISTGAREASISFFLYLYIYMRQNWRQNVDPNCQFYNVINHAIWTRYPKQSFYFKIERGCFVKFPGMSSAVLAIRKISWYIQHGKEKWTKVADCFSLVNGSLVWDWEVKIFWNLNKQKIVGLVPCWCCSELGESCQIERMSHGR